MTRQLVFMHGRSQQFKDAVKLKGEWIEAWKKGLAANGLELPIAETDIRFPYYGQTLHDIVEEAQDVAEVIIRGAAEGESKDPQEEAFIRAVVEEVAEKTGITDEQIESVSNAEVLERGPLNWPWVRAVLQAVDKYVPGGSGGSVALATKDVYQYLHNPNVSDPIDQGVLKAINPDVETIVVSHSLGTVVAYNMLVKQGGPRNWKIPLFVTLGSPLAVKAVKQAISPIKHPPCAGKWYNAMDPRDIVSLQPLDKKHFGITPDIENHLEVDNHTDNRHGIIGYLDDKKVAKKIYDALTA